MKKILFFLLLLCSAEALAQKATIDVQIEPKRAFIGEPLHLTITLVLGGNLQKVEVPTLDGLDIVAGLWPPSTPSVFIRGGFYQVPLADVYLSATKPGNLVFGKVKITVDGEVFESAPITIESLERPNTPSSGPVAQAADRLNDPLYGLPATPSDSLLIHAVTDRDQVFLGGSVAVSYWLLVRPGVRLSNLSIKKPEAQKAIVRSIVEFDGGNYTKREVIWGGTPYTAILLGRSAFIPLEAGALSISPMTISVLAGGVFGQGVERPSEALSLDVKPLPEGRPSASSSLVGDFQMTLSAPSAEAVSGEAFPVTLVVSGIGDLSGFEPSAFSSLKGARARPPAIKRDDGTNEQGALLSRMEAQYFIVPERPGSLTLEAPTIAVFSPDAQKWSTITAPPLSIKVSGAVTGSNALLQLRASRASLSGAPALIPGLFEVLAMVLGPLFLIGLTLATDSALTSRRAKSQPFIAAHNALLSAETSKDLIGLYAAITQMIICAAEAKTQSTLQGMVWRDLARALTDKTNKALGEKALAMLERADQIRYAPSSNQDEERSKALAEARQWLQSLEAQ